MTMRRGRLLAMVGRMLPAAAYVALATIVFTTEGFPLDRDRLSAWILGGLLCVSLGSLSSFVRSFFLEWLPLLAALTLYDILRGVGGGRVPIHGELQIWIDRYVFGFGTVPTVWLQQHLWNPAHLSWLDYSGWAVYTSYFLVTPLALAIVWIVDRELFRRYARQLTLLAFAAVAFFTASPTIPPWLAAQKGMLGTASVTRIVGEVNLRVHSFDATPLWERGVRLANDLAAFPSLHLAMTVLVVFVLWRRARWWLRIPLALYPLAMAFALVYTGEHYVIDLVGGVALAVAVRKVEPRLTARITETWARRRAPAEPGAVPETT
jgi:membrane-associated phospholipid phosphatase